MQDDTTAPGKYMGHGLGQGAKLWGGMPPYAEAFSRARPKWKWAGAAWRGARKVAQSGGRRLHSLVTKGKRGSIVT